MGFGVSSAFHKIKEQHPFIERYRHAWPVPMLIRQFLNNHCGHLRAKAAADEETPADVDSDVAGPSATTPTSNPGNDNDGDGSDANVSDIDD